MSLCEASFWYQTGNPVLSTDQITALAPDSSSLKAGRQLSSPGKWTSLGADDVSLWGLAQGSAAEPYQTRVSLSDLATKCTCPSRKFPCKHALGLMLAFAHDASVFARTPPPDWVTEWMQSRAAKAAGAAARAAETERKPPDEKAARKRREQREQRVEEGVSLLRQALLDLVREGLASSPARNPATWENLAKRMVDGQAPRLAGALYRVAEDILPDPQADQLLAWEAGRIHMLLHAAQHRESLDEATQAEVAHLLGGKAAPGTASEGGMVTDEWVVAGRRHEERDRLLTSITWLHGLSSRRWAVLLKFAFLPHIIADVWPLGATVRGSMRFAPGLSPERAHDLEGAVASPAPPVPEGESFSNLLERHARALTRNPFGGTSPFLARLHPASCAGFLIDDEGNALPWKARTAEEPLFVEAICGGHPTLACGEWDGRHLRLLSIRESDRWLPIRAGGLRP